MITTPLYGHDSRETAYFVESYPYGGLRCNIWFWLEYREGKGYRFCSQTKNPKNERMNAPKYGTYSLIAANMYLDENGHCTYAVLTAYSGAEEALQFIKNFPDTAAKKNIHVWAQMKAHYEKKCLEKNATPYGPMSDERRIEAQKALAIWQECVILSK